MAGKPKPDDKGWGRGKRPVIMVSWEEATAYANWLKEKTGKPYRLPTEAEWEYAARAGTSGDNYWGQANIKDFAWFQDNSGGKTQPVGEKKPNAFDLYDMSGNVWEWVQDHWHENYDNAPGDATAWMKNGNDGSRVLRGGSWLSLERLLRSENRNSNTPVYRSYNVGFRLAQD
jgi:formylglycine-generating enzyme required for sulfatase activity